MPENDPSRLRQAETRIEWVLANPRMSPWLKEALRSALDRDPVDVLNDLELLAILLREHSQALLVRGQATARD